MTENDEDRELTLYQAMLEATSEEDRSIRLWFALVASFTGVERVLRRHLQRRFDTSLPRFDVLTALVTFPDGLSMSELAARLGVTKGNVTGVVRRLQKDGWVDQSRQRHDRRVQLVVITPEGRKHWDEMRAEYRRLVEEMLAGLPDAELRSLTERLVALQRRIKRVSSADTD